jgi:hypothetical protein
MGQDLDYMLGWGDAWILVFESFQWLLLLYEVKHYHDSKQLHLSTFLWLNCSVFHLLFNHVIILCTIDHLPWIMVVLKDGPIIKFPKQCQHHFASSRHTFKFLGPGQWHMFALHALMFACKFIVVHQCFITCVILLQKNLSFFVILLQKFACIFPLMLFLYSSVSCFGTHLTQILWYSRSF